MPKTRSPVAFDRLYVDYMLRGGTRVTWEVRPDFRDKTPWTFTLQVNPNISEPDEWVDVGIPVTNANYAIDDTQRQFGKSLRTGYRVKLETPDNTYYSETAQVLGKLSKRQWLLARAILRRAELDSRGLENFPGYLLHRKRYGTACPDCLDPITGGIRNSDCETCNGTGRVTGYWRGALNTMLDVTPEPEKTERSDRGTVNDVIIRGKFVGIPAMARNDVWIDANSDRRYYVHAVVPLAEINRVPLITQAELRLAQFDDVIYSIDPEAGN